MINPHMRNYHTTLNTNIIQKDPKINVNNEMDNIKVNPIERNCNKVLQPYIPMAHEMKDYMSKPEPTPEIHIWTNLADRVLIAGVDCGSPLSFVKLEAIQRITKTFMFQWDISGITKDSMKTLGSINLKIFLNFDTLSIPVQVVSEKTSGLDYDILLGSDFQKKISSGY